LDEFPGALAETFERILLEIDEENWAGAYRVFQCLFASIRPLRVEELAEIFTMDFDAETIPRFHASWRLDDAEQSVLSTFSTLVTTVNVDGKQVTQFPHSSVREYLTSNRIATSAKRVSYFHIHKNQAHALLARACLSILLQLDDKIDETNLKNFPLASYAAEHWVDHAQFDDVSSHIRDAMECLFDKDKPHFAAWIWLYDIDKSSPGSTARPTIPDAVPLYYAALCGFRALAERLIDAHPQDVNTKGGRCLTPLHAALDKRHPNVSLLLLERGAHVDTRDNHHRTPLHLSSHHGYVNIVQLLLGRDADPDAEDEDKRTPLSLASRKGRLEVVRLLLEHGADINHRDSTGKTPLHEASAEGHHEVARLLSERRADANAHEKNLRTPLHLSADQGKLAVTQPPLALDVEVEAQDVMNCTPLHYASCKGDPAVVQVLLECGAKVDSLDKMDWTPLHFASQEGHLEVVRLLLENGADPVARNHKNHTSLEIAWEGGHQEIADVVARYIEDQTASDMLSQRGDLEVMRELIEHQHANTNTENEDQETPPFQGSRNGKLEATRLQLEHHADVNRQDWRKRTPLHGSSEGDHDEVTKLLLEHDTEVNAQHVIPLHSASQKGKGKVAEVLQGHKVNVDARNDFDWTPLHMASQKGHPDVLMQAIETGMDCP
jgi:ankyrin repeat protein